MDRFVLFLVQS